MSNYQVLARKWRPKNFADLVGQQHVVKALQNALDKGRLHHAYLLTGTRGVGKTTIARILAKSLNCEQAHHGEPCGQCQSCREIDAGRFVDLLEIDAASNTGIDNIREVLENAQYAPTAGRYKVYIIDEVHMLSKSAFNAMLKTLEEPPEHVKFILATTDPHKVPVTVLSRCLQFVLRNMTPQQVSEHLAHVLKSEQIVYEPAALTLLGRAAQGSMRDALSLLDQAIALGSGSVRESDVRQMIGAVDKRYLYELLTFLMEQDGEQLIAKAQKMADLAIGFDGALHDLALVLQRLALLKTVPNAVEKDDPEREHLLQLSHYFSDEQLQLYYQCVIHGKQDLPLAPDEYAGFVMTLLRMLAFAPFAAKNVPTQGTIEGTQLHTPEISDSQKKNENKGIEPVFRQPETPEPKQFLPQDLPPAQREEIRRESPTVPASSPENLANQHFEPEDDTTNHFRQPENLANQHFEPEDDTTNHFRQPENLANQHFEPEDDTTNHFRQPENLANQHFEPEDDATNHFRQPENLENQYFEPEDDATNYFRQPENLENQYFEPEYDAEAYFISPEILENQYFEPVYEPENSDIQNIEPEDDDAEDIFRQPESNTDPMPEFKPENWLAITERIAPSVAAAQMMLNHLAWVNWQNGVLKLALVEDKTKKSVKPSYFKRIAMALSVAYQQPIQVETEVWQADLHNETPFQTRERIAREKRETAQALLKADATAQALVATFQGMWVGESVMLKQ